MGKNTKRLRKFTNDFRLIFERGRWLGARNQVWKPNGTSYVRWLRHENKKSYKWLCIWDKWSIKRRRPASRWFSSLRRRGRACRKQKMNLLTQKEKQLVEAGGSNRPQALSCIRTKSSWSKSVSKKPKDNESDGWEEWPKMMAEELKEQKRYELLN